jgi:hypothetical protein
MTKVKFNLPKRINKTDAEDGVWTSYYSQALDHDFGRFRVRSLDATTKHMQRFAAEKAKHRNESVSRLSTAEAERAGVRDFVELCLSDWEVKDADGKLIPFDCEIAAEYLADEDCRDCADYLAEFARNIANFRSGLTKDEIVKN